MSTNPNVIIVENEHNDPVTVAFSALDAALDRLSGSDDEIARIVGKVARLRAEASDAEGHVEDAKAAKAAREADVAAAEAALAEAREANPVLAVEVDARRSKAKTDRIAEIKAELARLKGTN